MINLTLTLNNLFVLRLRDPNLFDSENLDVDVGNSCNIKKFIRSDQKSPLLFLLTFPSGDEFELCTFSGQSLYLFSLEKIIGTQHIKNLTNF